MSVQAKIGGRTKEQLIAAQREAQKGPWPAAASALELGLAHLTGGKVEAAVEWLATLAGRQWAESALRTFDLRRVDERGLLIEPGEIEVRPQHGHGLPGRDVVTWTAGEHLDAVLMMGGAKATSLVRRALEQPVLLPDSLVRSVSTLKGGELLVLDAGPEGLRDTVADRFFGALDKVLGPIGAKAIVLEGPVKRESVEHLRASLRTVGLDVVPLVRWEDLGSWLASLGFEVTRGDNNLYAKRGNANIAWTTYADPTDGQLAFAADALSMSVREVREAIRRHVEQAKIEEEARPRVGLWAPRSSVRDVRAALQQHVEPPKVYGEPLLKPLRSEEPPAEDRASKLFSRARTVVGWAAEGKLSVAEAADMLKTALSPLAPTEEETAAALRAALAEVPKEWATRVSAAKIGATPGAFDEVAPFGDRDDASRATFANILRAKKPMKVVVVEPDLNRAIVLLGHLGRLGGAKLDLGLPGVDYFAFGPVTVVHTMQVANVSGARADVAVGFDEQTAARITEDSPIRMAVHADDADRFWGLL